MKANKTLSADTIKPTVATDVTLDCGINVEGDAWINPTSTVFTDRITPHPDANAPMIVTVEGQMNVEGGVDLGSHDLAAENLYSDSRVKTKYLEATAGAVDNQIGVNSTLNYVKR